MSTKWFTICGTPKPSATSSASSTIYVAREPFTKSDGTVPSSSLAFYPPFSIISNLPVSSWGWIFMLSSRFFSPSSWLFLSWNSAFAVSTTLQSCQAIWPVNKQLLLCYFSCCSVFALFSAVLPWFHLCSYSCIIFHLSYLLYLPHVAIVNCVPIW